MLIFVKSYLCCTPSSTWVVIRGIPKELPNFMPLTWKLIASIAARSISSVKIATEITYSSPRLNWTLIGFQKKVTLKLVSDWLRKLGHFRQGHSILFLIGLNIHPGLCCYMIGFERTLKLNTDWLKLGIWNLTHWLSFWRSEGRTLRTHYDDQT